MKIVEILEDLKQNGLQTKKLQESAKLQDVETKKSLNDKLGENIDKVNKALEEQNKRLVEVDGGIKKDFDNIGQKFQIIGKDIDRLKSQMITQQQLNFVVEDVKKFKEQIINELEKSTESDNSFYDFSKHTNDEILDTGKKILIQKNIKRLLSSLNI